MAGVAFRVAQCCIDSVELIDTCMVWASAFCIGDLLRRPFGGQRAIAACSCCALLPTYPTPCCTSCLMLPTPLLRVLLFQ